MKLFGRKKEGTPAHREKPLVLVVDDEQDLTSILRLVLTERNYQVETANNGRAGLDKIRQLKPDLVLLDIIMPQMNGYQVLSTMQQDAALSGIPVIIMTSVSEDTKKSDEDWACSLDVCRFITKPFEPDTIGEEVDRLLRPAETPE